MYVHIDPEWLKQHPWVGVLIGSAGVILMLFVGDAFWSEYQRLRHIPHPEEITPETGMLTEETPRRWVTLKGGPWRCELAVKVEKRPPESWIFGRVDSTQIPVNDSTASKWIIVKYDGEVECRDVAEKPVTGMLLYEGDRVWGGSVARVIKKMGKNYPLLVLTVGDGPEKARKYVYGSTGFIIAFLAFAIYYLRLWIARGESLKLGR